MADISWSEIEITVKLVEVIGGYKTESNGM